MIHSFRPGSKELCSTSVEVGNVAVLAVDLAQRIHVQIPLLGSVVFPNLRPPALAFAAPPPLSFYLK